MKLIKIVILKIIKTKKSFYATFELKFFKSNFGKLAGNLIRTDLIKNIV